MASIPKKVLSRLKSETGRFQKVLGAAKDRDINEADTVTIVTDILAEVLGFDKYSEITSELAIRGTYCDLAIKIDDSIKYLIEVKAIGLNLNENHLRQAVNYGANRGLQWVILTNGIVWEVYKIVFEKPISHEHIFSINFLELNPRKSDDQAKLFVLCKEGVAKAAIEDLERYVHNVNKFIIGALLQSDAVTGVVRRELRRLSPGLRIEQSEVEKLIVTDVLKREVVEGEAPKKALARVKKAASRAMKKKSTPADGSPNT